MAIIATIMNTATGQPIQKMTFGRMPKPWVTFNLETGERVTADRVHVGKPAPGKFVAPRRGLGHAEIRLSEILSPRF